MNNHQALVYEFSRIGDPVRSFYDLLQREYRVSAPYPSPNLTEAELAWSLYTGRKVQVWRNTFLGIAESATRLTSTICMGRNKVTPGVDPAAKVNMLRFGKSVIKALVVPGQHRPIPYFLLRKRSDSRRPEMKRATLPGNSVDSAIVDTSEPWRTDEICG